MNNELLNSFIKTCQKYPGNSNSLHKLGVEAKKLEDAASKQILSVLKLNRKEIIYTSGRCESNNLAIHGVIKNIHKNKIITIGNVSSSITESIKKLENVELINIPLINNAIDIEKLKQYLNNDVFLISMTKFKNIDEIINILKSFDIYTHIDISNNTELIELNNFDLINISYDELLGFGALIKRSNISLNPLIHGGKSTTTYRSGTPALPFIVTFSKLVKLKYKK